jgi:hypothetical protein
MQQFRPPSGRPSWQGKGEVQVKNPEMLLLKASLCLKTGISRQNKPQNFEGIQALSEGKPQQWQKIA